MMLSSMVTRPKSIATVVVVFRLPEPASSTPTDSEVIGASVVSGSISERAPTVVVLPTPNPPEMRIFTGIGGLRVSAPAPDMVSEGSDTVDQPFNEMDVVRQGHRRGGAEQNARGDQISGQNLDDADREPDPRRHFSHRYRRLAGSDDRGHLGRPAVPDDRPPVPDQERLDPDPGGSTAGPATGQQIGPLVLDRGVVNEVVAKAVDGLGL